MTKLIRRLLAFAGIVKYNVYLSILDEGGKQKLLLVEKGCRNPTKYATVEWCKRYIWAMKKGHTLFSTVENKLYVIQRLR